jgi:hypothetical protein
MAALANGLGQLAKERKTNLERSRLVKRESQNTAFLTLAKIVTTSSLLIEVAPQLAI